MSKKKVKYGYFDKDDDLVEFGNEYEWDSEESAIAALEEVAVDNLKNLPLELRRMDLVATIHVVPNKLRIVKAK